MIKSILNRYTRNQWAGFFYLVCFTWIATSVGMGMMISNKGDTITGLEQTQEVSIQKILKLTSQTNELKATINKLKSDNDQLRAIEFNTLVDPAIIKGIIRIESNGDAKAHNKKEGAIGLMQLRPIVYKKICGMEQKDAFNPTKNVACGSLYFKHLLNRFGGNLEQALHFYNSGSPLRNGYAEKVIKKVCKGKTSCQKQLLVK